MKKLLLSAALVLGMMTMTTGCTGHTDGAAKKCGASGKCDQGKCGSKSDAKKCGDAKEAKKCGGDAAKKCGSK
jgi:hypothetical protein